MNPGPRFTDHFKQQQPTYHIAPNFTTRPFPNGPLELGKLVEDIKHYYPINQGTSNSVPIPGEQRYSDTKEDINVSIKTSCSGEASILAKVLDRSIGGEASLKGQKRDEDVYRIRKLETVYFYPHRSYINQCLQLSDVKDYLEMGDNEEPVYLITGLKIAWGATISTERGRSHEGNAGAGVTVLAGPVDVGVEARVGVAGDSAMSSSFGKPADFVLGIQVQKIYHKKKFWSGERTLTVERVVKRAVLVDNDELEKDDDAEAGDNFVIADMDDAELEGLVPWVGQDSKGQHETWLLPPNVF
ncbi:hypothetical protein FOVG_01374 [Fusarium oxysporum f. sp. pisi HDV247]|uniref:Uncharacterized protein n=1 Tax=Fusarium oxysporum f. sp. pisi HDV247 TaxID=1080344 RepID=W9QEQ1_FUSOX|nr:hypothetical protein FOVG_01374 [Fusarium oxysporum f. sp. pisi HDV247]